LDRPLPDSLPLALDSEKALLCSCIKSNELVDEPALEPELFALPAHRLIFERLRELFEHGSSIDFVVLKDFLSRSGELEQIGGAPYLSDLWDFVPSSANWKHYAKILAEVRTRRLGILSCSQLLKELVDPNTEIGPDLTERFGSIQRRLEASLRVDNTCLEMISQSQSQSYVQPPGSILLGDSHIVRGNVTVLAGPPGVGKSKSIAALAEAGACRYSWFGQPAHCRFKTFILQNENGRARLKTELADLDVAVEDYLRVTVPPPFGLCFSRRDFRRDLERALATFRPDLVIIDPWNAVARDDKARDYLESFDLVRSVIGTGLDAPAILIVAHTRKPLPGERANGRALMNLLAGSYVLSSIPRSIFILQHATDSVQEDRVIVTCCKNNDGQLGQRGCYRRTGGQWPEITNFDWQAWDHPRSLESENKKRHDYTEEVLQILADNKQLSKAQLVEQVMALAKIKKSTAYNMFDRSWFKTLVQTVRRTGLFKLRS
jgi:DnaB helicase-like protein/AAA domain-containing protein